VAERTLRTLSVKEHKLAVNELNLTQALPSSSSKTELMKQTYREISEIDSSSVDVLQQFQANMKTLEELNGRLRFMMSEIKGLVR
jgi:hypothetical protein